VSKGLSEGWEWKRLEKVCDVKKGTSITKSKVTEGAVPVIAGGQQPAYYHDVSNREGKTITISASGAYAGFINYFETPIFASDCTTIQSSDESKRLTRYVYLFLKSKQKNIYNLQTGAGQPHVYAKDLVKIEIPLPPLPIQKQIVAILEQAEKLKERREKANEETQKIIRNTFTSMFGDPRRNENDWSIAELNELILGFKYGTSVKSTPEGLPVLRIPNVIRGVIDLSDLKYVNISENEKQSLLLKEGDILFVRTNGNPDYVGRCAVFNLRDNYIYASYLIRARLNIKKVNPFFLTALLMSIPGKSMLREKTRTSAGQYNINTRGLGSLKIIYPPISLQNQFAENVKKVESLKERQKKSTQDINQLFDALMQKAFSGGLA